MVRIKIKKSVKHSIYLFLGICWISGIAFFIFNNWINVEGEFGPEKHPLQYKVLITHGFSAFIMLMLLGSVFTNHIPMGWKTKRLRKAGIALTSFATIQIITALFLYYMTDDYRNIVEYIHLICGSTLPVVLLIHIILGKRQK